MFIRKRRFQNALLEFPYYLKFHSITSKQEHWEEG